MDVQEPFSRKVNISAGWHLYKAIVHDLFVCPDLYIIINIIKIFLTSSALPGVAEWLLRYE